MLAIDAEDKERTRSMVRENLMALIHNHQAANQPTFLTQFNEKDEDESQSKDQKKAGNYDGGKTGVLRHGLEMKLQRNILARYKVDDEVAKKELAIKRQEFEKRINNCKEKQNQLIVKQDNNQNVVKNFSQVINEKELIRKRAIVKYQTELKIRLQKMIECDLLHEQLEKIKKIHEKKANRTLKNKKFKDFLTKAIELLPDDYLEAGESKYTSLMSRYQTLYECNVDLFEGLMSNADKLKVLKNEYERIIIEHNSNKMAINSKLGELQQIREKLLLNNENCEEILSKQGEKMRERVIDLFQIFSSIDNIAEKCVKIKFSEPRPISSYTLDEKMDAIVEYMTNKNEITRIVQELELKNPAPPVSLVDASID